MPEVAGNWPESGGSKGFSNNLQNQAPTYKNKLIFGIYGSKQVEKKPSLTGKVAETGENMRCLSAGKSLNPAAGGTGRARELSG